MCVRERVVEPGLMREDGWMWDFFFLFYQAASIDILGIPQVLSSILFYSVLTSRIISYLTLNKVIHLWISLN